jgi:hypothetical protein
MYTISSELCNGYSFEKLHDIISSHVNISDEERVVLMCQLSLFIGIKCPRTENIVKENLSYISQKIGYKAPD